MDSNDPELILLARGESSGDIDTHDGDRDLPEHQKASAPLFTREAGEKMGQTYQRGLLGSVLKIHTNHAFPTQPMDPRIYLNLNAPSSGLVCGVQVSVLAMSSTIQNTHHEPGLWEKSFRLLYARKCSHHGQTHWESSDSSCNTYVRVGLHPYRGHSHNAVNSFHFDAEGSGQPCEASFLTKKSVLGAAVVQDGIVLVS